MHELEDALSSVDQPRIATEILCGIWGGPAAQRELSDTLSEWGVRRSELIAVIGAAMVTIHLMQFVFDFARR